MLRSVSLEERLWNEEASDPRSWDVGQYWKAYESGPGPDGRVLVGIALVCPAQRLPGLFQRHWFLFDASPGPWRFDSNWGLSRSPLLKPVGGCPFQGTVVDGQLEWEEPDASDEGAGAEPPYAKWTFAVPGLR